MDIARCQSVVGTYIVGVEGLDRSGNCSGKMAMDGKNTSKADLELVSINKKLEYHSSRRRQQRKRNIKQQITYLKNQPKQEEEKKRSPNCSFPAPNVPYKVSPAILHFGPGANPGYLRHLFTRSSSHGEIQASPDI